jgi:hypothetical protein
VTKKLSIAATVLLLGACALPPQRVDTPRTEGPDKTYVVDLPIGWIKQVTQKKDLLASRDGILLDYILISASPLKDAFPKTKKAAGDNMLPAELAELEVAETKNQDQFTAALTVVENEPVEVAGQEGFRVRMRFKNNRGLELQRVVYGFADKSAYHRMEFGAPTLYYFDRYYPEFQKVVASFQLSAGNKKTAGMEPRSVVPFAHHSAPFAPAANSGGVSRSASARARPWPQGAVS